MSRAKEINIYRDVERSAEITEQYPIHFEPKHYRHGQCHDHPAGSLLYCTRAGGHKGLHVAHANQRGGRAVAYWVSDD